VYESSGSKTKLFIDNKEVHSVQEFWCRSYSLFLKTYVLLYLETNVFLSWKNNHISIIFFQNSFNMAWEIC
jgi:hypothetical protein